MVLRAVLFWSLRNLKLRTWGNECYCMRRLSSLCLCDSVTDMSQHIFLAPQHKQ